MDSKTLNENMLKCIIREGIDGYLSKYGVNSKLNDSNQPKNKINSIYFCDTCENERTIHYSEGTIVCHNCGRFEFYPLYVTSYNHPMRLKRICKYSRINNFKIILDNFLCRCIQNVQKEDIKMIKDNIENIDTLTVHSLEKILKQTKLMKHKKNIYDIFFIITNKEIPYITYTEQRKIVNMFKIATNIYDSKIRPHNVRKSFLNYQFVLKKLLIIMDKVNEADYILHIKTKKQLKETERLWKLIINDPDWKF